MRGAYVSWCPLLLVQTFQASPRLLGALGRCGAVCTGTVPVPCSEEAAGRACALHTAQQGASTAFHFLL